MRQIRVFLLLDRAQQMLLLEAAVLLGAASIAITILPFRVVGIQIGALMHETPMSNELGALATAKTIRRAVDSAEKNIPVVTTCFSRAVATKVLLRRRGVPTTLYLGVARAGDEVLAHAWLRCGTVTLTGAGVYRKFVPVCWFG